jgi:hypothetical protein
MIICGSYMFEFSVSKDMKKKKINFAKHIFVKCPKTQTKN